MAGVTITDRDAGWRALMVNTRNVRPVTVRVGVNDGEHRDAGGFKTQVAAPRRAEASPMMKAPQAPMKNDELGAIHEFGLGNNPERSFLRRWLDDESLWLPELEKMIDPIEGGEAAVTQASWVKKFGEFCVESVRARMRRGIEPPLKKETVARKMNGTTPLIETEQLMKAIEFDVKEGGGR